MAKWFGESWGAPVCTPENQVTAPVGERCAHCQEEIRAGEPGLLVPGDGARSYAYHRACFLRGIIGSVGHLEKRCSCYGGAASDPPGLSKRQAAERAEALWRHIPQRLREI